MLPAVGVLDCVGEQVVEDRSSAQRIDLDAVGHLARREDRGPHLGPVRERAQAPAEPVEQPPPWARAGGPSSRTRAAVWETTTRSPSMRRMRSTDQRMSRTDSAASCRSAEVGTSCRYSADIWMIWSGLRRSCENPGAWRREPLELLTPALTLLDGGRARGHLLLDEARPLSSGGWCISQQLVPRFGLVARELLQRFHHLAARPLVDAVRAARLSQVAEEAADHGERERAGAAVSQSAAGPRRPAPPGLRRGRSAAIASPCTSGMRLAGPVAAGDARGLRADAPPEGPRAWGARQLCACRRGSRDARMARDWTP